jgi:hypothetical protein
MRERRKEAVVRHKTLMLCAALAIPLGAVAAQRGGRGGAATAGGGAEGGAPRLQRPATAGQIEDLNPARLLVDKRKKLSLVDSQVAQMKVLEKKIKERNAALLAQYDSVRDEMRFGNVAPAPGSMAATMGTGGSGRRNAPSGSGTTMQTPEEAAKLREQLIALRVIGMQIRERRPADLAEALALLTPDQQKKAEEFVNEQEEEVNRLLPVGARGG